MKKADAGVCSGIGLFMIAFRRVAASLSASCFWFDGWVNCLHRQAVLWVWIETRPRGEFHRWVEQHGSGAQRGRCMRTAVCVFPVASTHSAAQIPVALVLPRQVPSQLRQRHFIDATLELNNHVERHPVVVPTPGVELWVVGGAQVQVPVVTDQLQQIPDLFLAL